MLLPAVPFSMLSFIPLFYSLSLDLSRQRYAKLNCFGHGFSPSAWPGRPQAGSVRKGSKGLFSNKRLMTA